MLTSNQKIKYLRSRGYYYSTQWLNENQERLHILYKQECKRERIELSRNVKSNLLAETNARREAMNKAREEMTEKYLSEGFPF